MQEIPIYSSSDKQPVQKYDLLVCQCPGRQGPKKKNVTETCQEIWIYCGTRSLWKETTTWPFPSVQELVKEAEGAICWLDLRLRSMFMVVVFTIFFSCFLPFSNETHGPRCFCLETTSQVMVHGIYERFVQQWRRHLLMLGTVSSCSFLLEVQCICSMRT